jgi:hypothetical protein
MRGEGVTDDRAVREEKRSGSMARSTDVRLYRLVEGSQMNQDGAHASNHEEGAIGSSFCSERISKTATIQLNGTIDVVFPLFNPVEEPKWEPRFKPHFIYPPDQSVQQGMTFKTAGHGDEKEFAWVVNQYDEAAFHIQYLVFTPYRYWTITIDCQRSGKNKTSATVTYEFTALEARGIGLNKIRLESMYASNLLDWEDAINRYLEGR